ncbi:hypothetical protein N8T08_009907 [Aspergillus melleus]|uniref:Uncharacterized protein n=1 Tax=Aspergillus melleus TaxID=138277 RepID=A0ACC3ASE2_9EURO|nr:hypothetical protein N8T08_009907 [Aspergillus melleus]
MVSSLALILALLGSANAATTELQFANRDSATGQTDPDVSSGCTYWANSIESTDTCAALEDYFGITTAQLVSWHLNLSVHRGLTMICPFCKHGFTSASGVTSHLENGSCQNAPSFNREKVYRIMNRSDPSGFITKKQIEWYPEDSAQYSATNQAFNGSFWQCWICHREFLTVHGLNQHLNSPVHKQNLYHCPNKGNCGKEFVTLAALFNHLESESCRLVRFETMNQCVNDVVQTGSSLTS